MRPLLFLGFTPKICSEMISLVLVSSGAITSGIISSLIITSSTIFSTIFVATLTFFSFSGLALGMLPATFGGGVITLGGDGFGIGAL